MLIPAIAQLFLLGSDRLSPVEAQLKTVLRSAKGSEIRWNQDTLVVRFRTHTVKVPRQSKNRRKKPGPLFMMEQPTLKGLMLEVRELPREPFYEILPMQAVRMSPHWITDYGSYKMDAGRRRVDGKDLYYRIEWGNQVDSKLLRAIQDVLNGKKQSDS